MTPEQAIYRIGVLLGREPEALVGDARGGGAACRRCRRRCRRRCHRSCSCAAPTFSRAERDLAAGDRPCRRGPCGPLPPVLDQSVAFGRRSDGREAIWGPASSQFWGDRARRAVADSVGRTDSREHPGVRPRDRSRCSLRYEQAVLGGARGGRERAVGAHPGAAAPGRRSVPPWPRIVARVELATERYVSGLESFLSVPGCAPVALRGGGPSRVRARPPCPSPALVAVYKALGRRLGCGRSRAAGVRRDLGRSREPETRR